MEDEFIKDLARKYANVCEFKSDFPHDWNSVNDGFIEGFKTAVRLIKTSAMGNSSHESSGLNKPVVSGSALPDHGICMENACQKPATKDYNGHGHWVCDYHYKTLNDYFDEEYD